VVRHTLSIARTPIPWTTLAEEILSQADQATPDMVEKLLTEMWDASLLLTDLRPPLTHLDPAGYVLERLRGMGNVAESFDALEKILTTMERWDAEPKKTAQSYREIVSLVTQVGGKEPRSAIQVDSALNLTSNHLSHAVAEEVARAAELLMRISPWPDGPAYLHDYRRAFQSRYGDREIPLLQLLDPSAGLGPPPAYSNAAYQSAFKVHGLSAAGNQLLLDIAYRALRDKEAVLQIDNDALKLLETSHSLIESVPTSLDIYASVAAASAEAVDRGEFKVALGPNLGAGAAGRNMGRFAGLLGREAQDALEHAARTEEALRPSEIWAELAYLPQRLRSSNVTIRPAVRRFEIAWGIPSSLDPANTIPLNELVVGVAHGRFYLRWTHSSAQVVVCMGHMLNYARAPMACRLLSDIGRDRFVQLSGFSWGPASNFPFLPRVEYGRVVLRPAQWRIQAATFARQFSHHENAEFLKALTNWRTEWKVPRHVYLSEQDNRLLLDLEDPLHCEELRRNGRALRPAGRLVLEEVFPALEDAWVQSEQGHHVAEIVVSLVRRPSRQPASVPQLNRPLQSNVSGSPSQVIAEPEQPPVPERAGGVRQRLRPPGSEWLFIKLYCNPKTIEDLLTGPVRDFTSSITAAEVSNSWFFLRYSDPDPHIRVRFAGEPGRLTKELLPEICGWASSLMDEEKCLRFTLETYEREVERYGGNEGISVAELVFFHDAWAAVELLHLAKWTQMTLDRGTLALLSLDALLDGLGLDPEARLSCCRKQSTARKEASTDFQNKKGMLRKLLGQSDSVLADPGGKSLLRILADLRTRLRVPARQLQQLQEVGKLTRPLDDLYTSFVHMHLNRMGVSGPAESSVIALLWRVHQSLSRSPLVSHTPDDGVTEPPAQY
jgi:thiopeptide-type bacteriocin biosynthesis protein